MKSLLLTTALMLAASPAFAKDYTIKEVTDYDAKKQNFFSPDKLTIQPGDTVTFENVQDEQQDVMFNVVPKAVNQMIMSPTFEKKGEKFSYTFTIPGTYKFHCHPHEALGMTGTLIVGQPSKPGETKKVSHHDMHVAEAGDHHHDAAASSQPQGTGTINSIDADKHTIKMTHDPIKALGWPKMTMLFTVDSSIDLSSYHEGDAVSFTLKPVGKDDYTVTILKKQ
jgi:plastocyanin/Cu/Ag efflux protein CusF